MDFTISEEQENALAWLDSFCRDNLKEADIQQWIAEGSVPDSFMLKYVQDRYGRVGLPEQLNGVPATNMTCVLMLERLALRAGATLPIQPFMTYRHFINSVAGEKQIGLLQNVTETTGKLPFSLAISEPQTGSNAYDIRTVAIEDDDGFTITGAKSFITLGQYCPYIIVAAHDIALDDTQDAPDPFTFFLVPQDAPGLDTFPMAKVGQRLLPMADILFDNVHVGKDSVVGQRGGGATKLLNSFEYSRTYLCATTVGLAEAAFEEAVAYALNRNISDASIFSFQQVQEMATDMQVKIDAMRALLYKTAFDLDSGNPDTRLNTALLKRFVPKTALEVADSAIQMMGGLGYLSSSRTARIWEECRGNRIQLGTDEVMTVIASKRIAKRVEAEFGNEPTWRF